eukprot:1678228-Alexandrium_andersonii.AAC.1
MGPLAARGPLKRLAVPLSRYGGRLGSTAVRFPRPPLDECPGGEAGWGCSDPGFHGGLSPRLSCWCVG